MPASTSSTASSNGPGTGRRARPPSQRSGLGVRSSATTRRVARTVRAKNRRMRSRLVQPDHAEGEQKDRRDGQRQEQRTEAAEAVREEDEHGAWSTARGPGTRAPAAQWTYRRLLSPSSVYGSRLPDFARPRLSM